MKKILLIPFLLFAALSMAACGGDSDEPFTSEQPEQPENPGGGDDSDDNPDTPAPGGNGRYLVLYASRTNNTERVAQLIQTTLDCDILEVEPETAYDNDYNSMLERSQEELAIKLNVVRQTVSKWENGLSVPDSSMLIILANELDTTVSELLGEPIAEPTTDDLKILSEKLEVINLQLAKRSITKVKTIRWILISLCAVIVVIFIALASTNSFYLDWNYNDPELAVAGTILHGFEFLFVRLAPIVFWTSVVGIVVTYKKR